MTATIQDLARLSQNLAANLGFELVSLPPATPLNVKANGERMLIRVQWAEVDDVDGYRVAVMTNQNLANPDIGLFTVEGAKQREFVYQTGNNALTRFFAVQSFIGQRFSEFSPVVSATSTAINANDSSGASTQTSYSAGAEAVMRTITIAGNTLGTNDGINAVVLGTLTATASTTTVRLRWGGLTGAIVASAARTNGTNNFYLHGQVFNRNAANSQICGGLGFISGFVPTAFNTTATLDTTASQTLVVTGQDTGGGPTVVDLVDTFIIRGAASTGDSPPPSPPSNPPGSGEPPSGGGGGQFK